MWRKYNQNKRQPIQVENMMTESLRQINSSLQEANKVLVCSLIFLFLDQLFLLHFENCIIFFDKSNLSFIWLLLQALTSLTSIMDAVSSCSGDNGFKNKNSKMITSTQEKHRCHDKLPKNKYFGTQQRKSACCLKMKQCPSDIPR